MNRKIEGLTPTLSPDVGTMDLRDGHPSAYAGPLSHWERAGVRERSLAHVFDETFGVNSAFNAEVFVAAPHAVAMEFDLFGKRCGHLFRGRRFISITNCKLKIAS